MDTQAAHEPGIPNEIALNTSATVALCSNPFLHYIWQKHMQTQGSTSGDVLQKLSEFVASNKELVRERVLKHRPLTDEWIINKIANEKGLVGMTLADVRNIEQWVDEQLAK